MKERNSMRILAIVFLVLFVMFLIGALGSNSLTKQQSWNCLCVSVVCAFFAIIFFIGARLVDKSDKKEAEKKAWNDLPIEEKCERMAADLKSGERSWYLNPNDGMYLAVPLTAKDMNEFGGGAHIPTTELLVRDHLRNGKISNTQVVEKVLSFS
jgi:hypothetical protein